MVKDEAPRRRRAHDRQGLAADLDRFGFCIAEDVLGADALARARRIVDQAAQECEATARPDGAGGEDRAHDGDRWVLLIAGECGLDDLVAHPLALALARHLLGRRVQLSGFTAHAIDPGNRAMALHTDQWWLPAPALPSRPPRRPRPRRTSKPSRRTRPRRPSRPLRRPSPRRPSRPPLQTSLQ